MDYEAEFWGSCSNTFHEEQKQLVYASRMGLLSTWRCAHPPTFDIGGRSVVDIGGGPCSLLLKCVNRGDCSVLDPGDFPEWVWERYAECDVVALRMSGEDLPLRTLGPDLFDEAWIYNTLQHVEDPERVIENARATARTIRIFEWVDVDPYPGHEHRLAAAQLDEWLDGQGFTAEVSESGAVGRAYYGVFSTA